MKTLKRSTPMVLVGLVAFAASLGVVPAASGRAEALLAGRMDIASNDATLASPAAVPALRDVPSISDPGGP
jgi:hypothetical protein